jgi:flagellar basal-body rod protein FlgC
VSNFSVFDIAGSGMSAQSIRLNATASNIANARSVSSSTGETYRARYPVFATIKADIDSAMAPFPEASAGVQVLGVVEGNAPPIAKYEPNHPMANEDGYIYLPNVNVIEEMANMMSSSRAYQTNVEILNTAKEMLQRTLTLGQ